MTTIVWYLTETIVWYLTEKQRLPPREVEYKGFEREGEELYAVEASQRETRSSPVVHNERHGNLSQRRDDKTTN